MESLTPATPEKPTLPVNQRPINMRRALAGINLLKGCSLGEAIRLAGYSKSTSRNPKRNELSEIQCLEEAKRLEPTATPLALVDGARRVALQTLRGLEALQPHELAEKPAPVAKFLEVIERYHGTEKPDDAQGVRDFVARAFMMKECLAQLESRGVLGVENVHSHNPASKEVKTLQGPKNPDK